MTDPQVFYNKEDMWVRSRSRPPADCEIPVAPYYVIMALPGEPKEEFLLMQPYSPSQQDQHGPGWRRAWTGRTTASSGLRVPQRQAGAGTDAGGSHHLERPHRLRPAHPVGPGGEPGDTRQPVGHPGGDASSTWSPLYLQAEQSPIPELKRVIVSYRNRVVMEPTLAEALGKLFPARAAPRARPRRAEPRRQLPVARRDHHPRKHDDHDSGGTTTTLAPGSTTTTVTLPGALLPTDPAA